jgi:hypothetical protein
VHTRAPRSDARCSRTSCVHDAERVAAARAAREARAQVRRLDVPPSWGSAGSERSLEGDLDLPGPRRTVCHSSSDPRATSVPVSESSRARDGRWSSTLPRCQIQRLRPAGRAWCIFGCTAHRGRTGHATTQCHRSIGYDHRPDHKCGTDLVVFDNTASGAAIDNAWELRERVSVDPASG